MKLDNKVLSHLNYEILNATDVDKQLLLSVWMFFFKQMVKLGKNQSLKVLMGRTLKNTLYVMTKEPLAKASYFFLLQSAALGHLVSAQEKGQLTSKDHLLLFDEHLNSTIDFLDRLLSLQDADSDGLKNVIELMDNCLFPMLKLGVPLINSSTITNSIFKFVGRYFQLLHRQNGNSPQSFIYFFEMVVNSKLHVINHRFNEFKENRTLLFVLTVNLVSFIKDKRNLMLLYRGSDFYGEESCERLVTNTLELFNNLIKLDGEDRSTIKQLEAEILAIVNGYLSEKKRSNELTHAIHFIQEAKGHAKNPKNYKAFINQHFGCDDSKNPLLLYFVYPDFSGEVLSSIIGGEYEENTRFLSSFLTMFNFKGLTVLQALRQIFLVYKMKGETQMIERILSGFADRYCAQNEGHSDTVFALMFAFLMLNTDHHNVEIKEKMNFASFLRNVRYVADENYLSVDKVKEAYANISESEIKYFDLEKLQQKPSIFSDFDWRYVIETRQKIKQNFFSGFLPSNLELSEIFNDKNLVDDCIGSRLRHLFEHRFFNNIPFVLQSNLYNYQMVELLIDFFKNQSIDTRQKKIGELVTECDKLDFYSNDKEKFWTFESVMLILGQLLDRSGVFSSMFLRLFFNHYKVIYIHMEDECLAATRPKVDIICRNTKDGDKTSKSIARVFKGFLSIDSGDEDIQRDEIERKNVEERRAKYDLKASKVMFKKIVASFPESGIIIKGVLDELMKLIENSKDNLNTKIKPLVILLHIIKDIALVSKKENIFVRYRNTLLHLRNQKFEVASHLSECLYENLNYLIACSSMAINLAAKTSPVVELNEVSNGDEQSCNPEVNENDKKVRVPKKESISSFENIYSEDESAEISEKSRADFLSYIPKASPAVLEYILEELLTILTSSDRVCNEELVNIINVLLPCIAEKKKTFETITSFKSKLHSVLTKAASHIVSDKVSESLFFVFQFAETVKSILDIDVLSIYFPILDAIKFSNVSVDQKNRLLLLTFDKLGLDSAPPKISLKSFQGLINMIVRLIDFAAFEVSKIEFVIEHIFKAEHLISLCDIDSYEELLDSMCYVLTRNANVLYEHSLMQRYMPRYIDMLAIFLNRVEKTNSDIVT